LGQKYEEGNESESTVGKSTEEKKEVNTGRTMARGISRGGKKNEPMETKESRQKVGEESPGWKKKWFQNGVRAVGFTSNTLARDGRKRHGKVHEGPVGASEGIIRRQERGARAGNVKRENCTGPERMEALKHRC